MKVVYDVSYEIRKSFSFSELNEFIINFKAYEEGKCCSIIIIIIIQNKSSLKSLKLFESSIFIFGFGLKEKGIAAGKFLRVENRGDGVGTGTGLGIKLIHLEKFDL